MCRVKCALLSVQSAVQCECVYHAGWGVNCGVCNVRVQCAMLSVQFVVCCMQFAVFCKHCSVKCAL